MLVDVVPLRHLGTKLARDALPPATRGDLAFLPGKGAPLRDGTAGYEVVYTAALLADGADLLPKLHRAWLAKIDGDSMLISGEETVLPHPKGAPATLPQTWWVRAVHPPL